MKRRKKEHPNAQGLTLDWRDNDPSVGEERVAFLKAAADHKSIRLGDSLHANVWRKFQEEPEKYESREETMKLMWDWAASVNLAVFWAVSMCFSAIGITWLPKKTIRFDSVVIYSHPPTFQFPNWDMREDEAKYRRHVNQMFAAIRDEYIADSKKRRSSLFDSTRQKWSRGDAIRMGGPESLSWMDIRSNSGEVPRSSAVGQGNGYEDLRPHRLIRLSQAFVHDLTCIAG